jgi:hypothetical protein
MANLPEDTPSSPKPGSQPVLADQTCSKPSAEYVAPLKEEELHTADKGPEPALVKPECVVSKGWKTKLYEFLNNNNEMVVAGCTVVIAFAAVMSWHVARQQSEATQGQLQVMEQQLKEMKGSSDQSDRLIKQATKQAEALTDQVVQLKASVEGATRQSKAAEEANKISATGLTINRNAVDETLKLTRQGLELSRQSLIASQRAWLIPKTMTVTFNSNRTVTVNFRVSNTGRSPATRLHGYMSLFEQGAPEIYDLAGEFSAYPNTLIGPGAENDHYFAFDIPFGIAFSQERIDLIASGKIKSRISGAFFYSDDYAIDRVLRICGLYEPKQNAYNECPTQLNEASRNSQGRK